MKRRILLVLACVCSLAVVARSQTTGRVVDQEGTPIAFANVALHSLPDSTLITGVVTDDAGRFSLPTADDHSFLRISFVGYEPQTVATAPQLTVVLQPGGTELAEVEVKAARPIYRMEANGLSATIENTLLARLGNATEVLGQLPFVSTNDGKVTVFGRGNPLIYINNRLMRHESELQQLNVADVRDVKVILNPGAEYDATVGAVIRITTRRPVGEGLSGSLHAAVQQTRRTSGYTRGTLKWRRGGLDLFGSIDWGRMRNRSSQYDEIEINNTQLHRVQQDIVLESDRAGWDATAGFNLDLNRRNSIGLKYEYERSPRSLFSGHGTTTHAADGIVDRTLQLDITERSTSQRNYLNGYYHAEWDDKTEFHFDADAVSGSRSQPKNAINRRAAQPSITVGSESTMQYSLFAGKAWIARQLWGGRATIGSEVSHTDNRQSYRMLNADIAADLPSNSNRSIQTLAAAFASFARTVGAFALEGGLRYEHIDFDYYLNGTRQHEQSRVYNDLSPSLSVAWRGPVNLSLTYRQTTQRPGYNQLRSSISYYDPYTYEGGNPSLRPTFINRLTALFGWKDLQAVCSYSLYTDEIVMVGRQFKDKSILLFTNENVPSSARLSAGLSWSPTFGPWKPQWQVEYSKQFLEVDGTAFNAPGFNGRWNNTVQLPSDWLATFNIWGMTGTYDLSRHAGFVRADAGISRRFFHKSLNVALTFTDLFGTNREQWSTRLSNVYFYKWNGTDRRGCYLQLNWNFNPARDKYRGRQASDELNRL